MAQGRDWDNGGIELGSATTASETRQHLRAMRHVHLAPRRKGLYADCLRTYLEAVAQLPQRRMLDRILLRTASRRGVDLMALSATDGRLRYKDLLEYVNTPGKDWQELLARSAGALDPSTLARIARVVALQDVEPEDRANALKILRWVFAQCGAEALDRDEKRLFQNLAFVQGDFSLAAELFETLDLSRTDKMVMGADLANPWGPSPYHDFAKWQSRFAKLFERHQVEAPRVATEGSTIGEAFDGLRCQIADSITDGPLVSVIMTCWQPGAELEISLRSILNQTWRNLEILLIDDASPPAYQEILLRAQAMDPRIRLLQQTENRGTYVARSAALAVATGEFVTGQDSDDWSHPRRIEKQVTTMLTKEKLVSTTSHALRCDPSMLFVAPGMLARRENASSLMFRREPAIEHAGYYDATRKGGDTEYMLRLQRVFGEHSHRLLETDLAIIRRSRESLSHAEFRPGWRHPARTAYRRSYEFWHQIESRNDALRLDGKADSPRRFPLPQRFAVQRLSARSHGGYDVVFVDDLRPSTGTRHLRALLDEVNGLLAAGLRVGIAHLRSFRDVSFEPIDNYWSPFARLIHEGAINEVLLTDSCEVGTIVIRRPEVVLFFSPVGTALRPGKVIVVAEEPVRQSGKRVWYDPTACHRNLRDAFPVPIEWAAGARIGKQLRAALPAKATIGPAYPIVVDARHWRYPARIGRDRQPIVGYVIGERISEGAGGIADLQRIFTEESGIQVRVLDDKAVVRAVLRSGHLPSNWSVTDVDADLEAFLGGCDFLVDLDCTTGNSMLKRLFSQAMASGCIVIAKPECAAIYRGVVGCDPREARAKVEGLWQDADSFRSQVEFGLRSVRDQDGSQKRRTQLANMLGSSQLKGSELSSRKRMERVETGRVGAPGVSWVVRQHVALYESRGLLREIDRTILRTGSLAARDILACMASRGGLGWNQVRAMLSEYRAGRQVARTRRVFGELDPRFARRLGRVVALQALLPDDRISALTLFKTLVDAQGVGALDPQHGKLALDLAFYLRDWSFLKRYRSQLPVNEVARRFIELDLHNPFVGSPFADHAKWLALFNQHYLDAGITPLQLDDPGEVGTCPFDRLSTRPLDGVADGDLVTVVTSSWHPDESLVHAIRSITRQTWRNLEILLVDDASPPEFTPLLERVAASDPRIRLIRQPENRGTYVARNRGMVEAKGRYFTVHDSDDWAHPQRIEMQVRALQEDEKLVSSGSFAFRCNDDLVVNFPGVLPDRENASSLTFELDKVRREIGYFDASRKGADTEYVLRMRAAFGQESHRVLAQPLAMIRLRPDSLSRAEFKPGWRHPARALYRRAYEAWHRRIKHDPAGALVPFPLEERPFALPARFQVHRALPGQETGRTYDIVFAADFRASASLDRSICHEILAAHKAGLKVGVLHMESFWHASLREIEPFDPDLEQWLHDKLVDEVLFTDDCRVSLLVVRDPSVLQFPQSRRSTLSVGRALIVAGRAENEGPAFDAGDCANHAFGMFGIEPHWCTHDDATATAMAQLVSVRAVDPSHWPEAVVESLLGAAPGSDFPGRNVVSTDELPSTVGRIVPTGSAGPIAAWWAAFGESSSGSRMRLLGTHAEQPLEGCQNVTIEANWIPRLPFLAQCDFYTDHPAGARDSAQHRWILEALVQGCIPILSPQWEPVFGDAAQYCLAEDLLIRISAFVGDLEGQSRARARAAAWISRHASIQSLQPFWVLARNRHELK